MSMPKNVEDALEIMESRWNGYATAKKVIWTHLMSLETELADYKNASMHSADDMVAKDAKIHRLTEIASGVDPLVVRLHEVTEAFHRSDEQAERLGARLAAADSLLRKTLSYVSVGICSEIQYHLRAGDTEAK